MTWEAYAIRYGRHDRPAQSNHLLPVADPHEAMPLDYFVWLLRGPDGREVVVDTGFNAELAERLGWRNATFSYHRGMIELGLGRRAAAGKYLRAALALNPHFSVQQAPLARKALSAL